MLEMRNRTWQCLAGLVCLAGIGCGADPGTSDDALAARDEASAVSPQEVPVLEERVLAELKFGDERHTFVLLGEEPNAVVSHRIVGSAGGRSSVRALASAEIPPTMLETFLALAPPGLEAPPELVVRHEEEARALGRPEEVHQLLVEKDVLTAPAGVDACNPDLFFEARVDRSVRGWEQEIAAGGLGDSFHCVGGPAGAVRGFPDENSCTFLSSRARVAGVCNNGDRPLLARVGEGFVNTWAVTRGVILEPNQYLLELRGDSVDQTRMAAIGEAEGPYAFRVGVMLPFSLGSITF